VGENEVLLDDTRRFAEAATAAGVSVSVDIYRAMPHAFHATGLPAAATLMERITAWLLRPEGD
jgi:acetyl esterase/lipase